MFGPFLDEAPEGQEVEEAGVDIGDGVGAVVVIVEMVEFFDDELLDVVPEFGLVAFGVEVEDVRVGLIGVLKDAQIFYAGVVLAGYYGDLFVEGRVVARDLHLYRGAVLEGARADRFSTALLNNKN